MEMERFGPTPNLPQAVDITYLVVAAAALGQWTRLLLVLTTKFLLQAFKNLNSLFGALDR